MPSTLQPGTKRYLRAAGSHNGDEILTLGRVDRMVWACLFPDQSIRLVSLGGGKILTTADPSVAWVFLGEGAEEGVDWVKVPGWIELLKQEWSAGTLGTEVPWFPPQAKPALAEPAGDDSPEAPAERSAVGWGRVRALPRRVWLMTAPLGSNVTRGLAICVGGALTYQAGQMAAHRLGLFAMISAALSETMETYESASWVISEILIWVEFSQDTFAEVKDWGRSNPFLL